MEFVSLTSRRVANWRAKRTCETSRLRRWSMRKRQTRSMDFNSSHKQTKGRRAGRKVKERCRERVDHRRTPKMPLQHSPLTECPPRLLQLGLKCSTVFLQPVIPPKYIIVRPFTNPDYDSRGDPPYEMLPRDRSLSESLLRELQTFEAHPSPTFS